MDIRAYVDELLGIPTADHERLSLWLTKFDLINITKDHHSIIKLSKVAIKQVSTDASSVAKVFLEKLKFHLDWAIGTDRQSEVDKSMQAIVKLSKCEEVKLSIKLNHGFTESFFRLLFHHAGSKWASSIINLVDQNVVNSRFVVEFLLQYLVSPQFNMDTIRALIEACSGWSLFLHCLIDHPSAPQLVNGIVATLEQKKDAVDVLFLSTLLLWLTKDRQLLEGGTPDRILKLAISTFESTSNVEEIEACCAFFTISCMKITMASRLQRILLAGLLRQLFEKNCRTIVPAIVDLLILLFKRSLLTPHSIPQHCIPLEQILRWVNGHFMESVRAAKLLSALAAAGFFTDEESRSCIREELKNVLDINDKGRLMLLGGFISTTKICLPSHYYNLAKTVRLSIPITDFRIALREPYSLEWIAVARLALLTDPCLWGSDHAFCELLFQHDLLIQADMDSLAVRVNPGSSFVWFHRLLKCSILAIQEKLEFYIRCSSSNVKDDNQTELSLVRLQQHIRDVESKNSVKDKELLSLQFRLATEASKALEYYEHSQKWQSHTKTIIEDLKVLFDAIASDRPDVRPIASYLEMFIGEVESLRQTAKTTALKYGDLKRRIADLEKRLLFTSEESKMYREACAIKDQQLETVRDQESQLVSHINVLKEQVATTKARFASQEDQINGLDQRLLSTEGRLHEALNQYHETREALARTQLTEGRLRLELQSSQSLLELRDQQIESLRSQIQDMNNRLLSR